MAATCIFNYTAFITCDGQGVVGEALMFGPYTVQASAMAHIDGHGAVCTGLGEAGVTAATCQAKIFEEFNWQDV